MYSLALNDLGINRLEDSVGKGEKRPCRSRSDCTGRVPFAIVNTSLYSKKSILGDV